MALLASDVLNTVSQVLLDETNARWSAANLLAYLNEAQRQLVTIRPEAVMKTEIALLQPGVAQVLPAGARALVDVPRNVVDVLVPSTPTITIVAASADKNEGDSGTTNFTFTVTRNTAVGASSVTYAVGGTGTHPAATTDFIGGAYPTGTVSWTAGETSKTLAIAVSGDTTNEYDETFEVVIANPTNGVIAIDTAIGTIVNDDLGYLYLVTASAARSEVRALALATGTLSAVLDTDSGLLNAMAYNPVGDVVYAMRIITSERVSISSAGIISNVGTVTGLPWTDPNCGTCLADGTYIVGQTAATAIYRIDTLTATLVVNLSLAVPGYDFEVNPADGLLYTVHGNQCYVYNLGAGTYTQHAISGLPTGVNAYYGAQAIAGNYMYVTQNDDGAGNSVVYRFLWATFGAASVVLTHVGTFPNLDGCRPLNPAFIPA